MNKSFIDNEQVKMQHYNEQMLIDNSVCPTCSKPFVSGSLPTVDEAGIAAVKISEMVDPPLTAQEQAFFIAGFSECIKWLSSNDR